MTEPHGDLEARLRGLMTTAVDMPFRRIETETVRRRVLRRRRTASVAVITAVALVSGLGVALAAQRNEPGHGQPTGSRSHSASDFRTAGVPHFYIVRTTTSKGQQTTVRATATGAPTATVRCPHPPADAAPWPIAPAADQTFFLVCQAGAGQDSPAKITHSRIYRFQVTKAGRVGTYAPVPGGTLGALNVRAITATPDGSEIAIAVYPGSVRNFAPTVPVDVIVINTRTGARATWHAARPASGKTVYWPEQISLTADGRRLAFLTMPQCFSATCTVHGGQQVRVIENPASGGNLNSARLLVRLSSVLNLSAATVMAAVISPDGSTLTLAIGGNLAGKRLPDSVSIVQVPATGDGRIRLVYRLAAGDGYGYSYFSADPSVRHFLLGASSMSQVVQGRIAHGRLIRLRPAAFTVDSAVW
ncbi:MAG: hypothetical protein ACTHKL_21845 [Streptosporangiaceae bacterium]